MVLHDLSVRALRATDTQNVIHHHFCSRCNHAHKGSKPGISWETFGVRMEMSLRRKTSNWYGVMAAMASLHQGLWVETLATSLQSQRAHRLFQLCNYLVILLRSDISWWSVASVWLIDGAENCHTQFRNVSVDQIAPYAIKTPNQRNDANLQSTARSTFGFWANTKFR